VRITEELLNAVWLLAAAVASEIDLVWAGPPLARRYRRYARDLSGAGRGVVVLIEIGTAVALVNPTHSLCQRRLCQGTFLAASQLRKERKR